MCNWHTKKIAKLANHHTALLYALKDDSAKYFWSCIYFSLFFAHWNMWNNINHWHKNTQLELFWTLLSCNYNTTISLKTNWSITSLTSWKIDFAETTKLGGWLVFSLGFAHVPLGWLINTQMCHAYFQVNTFRLQANSKMWWYGTNSNNNDLLNLYLRKV